MNILAVILVALGIGLIIVGWNGTYANVWEFLSNQGGSQQPQPQPPTQQNQLQGSRVQYHPAYGRYQ